MGYSVIVLLYTHKDEQRVANSGDNHEKYVSILLALPSHLLLSGYYENFQSILTFVYSISFIATL